MFPGHSVRQRQNIAYLGAARALLGINDDLNAEQLAEHPFGWLAGHGCIRTNGWDGVRAGILTELGRILFALGPDATRECAEMICRDKPSVKDGIAHLRRMRALALGKEARRQARGSQVGLLQALAAAFDAYRDTHRMSAEAALWAVDALREIVEDMAEQGKSEAAPGNAGQYSDA